MSKTPGGQQASDKYVKQQQEAQGAGAPNAPGHTNIQDPLEAPVAGDSGKLPNVGITEINNKSANTSGALNTEGTDGTTRVGVGAPTGNIPPEQRD